MKTYKVTLVTNSVWSAYDWLNSTNTDPYYTDAYILKDDSEEEIGKVKSDISESADIYNDAFIYKVELTDVEILENTDYESIEDFEKDLETFFLAIIPKVSDYNGYRSGDDNIRDLIKYICENKDWEYLEVPNYDHHKSIEGAILVEWSWQTYVGYARKFEGLRYARYDEDESLLAKRDSTFVIQVDMVLSSEEVEKSTDLQAELEEALMDGWKWRNPEDVRRAIEGF